MRIGEESLSGDEERPSNMVAEHLGPFVSRAPASRDTLRIADAPRVKHDVGELVHEREHTRTRRILRIQDDDRQTTFRQREAPHLVEGYFTSLKHEKPTGLERTDPSVLRLV